MKKFALPLFALMLTMSLSGCGLMEDAFKAGIIFAVIIVAVIGLIVWLVRIVARQVTKRYDLELK